MSISLYAVGTADIEVGRYGMTLSEAKDAFLAVCKKHKCQAILLMEKKNVIRVHLKGGDLYKLLHAVADVEDLHGDPPDTYELQNLDVPKGKYVRAGSYND